MENETKNELITEAEGNKLIAVFMGLKPNPSDGGRTWGDEVIELNGETYSPEWTTLKYHKSWDWLMPAVEKWNSISKQKQKELEDYLDLDNPKGWRAWSYRFVHLTTDINYVRDHLVSSIQWYNETQSRGGGN
jgi:hypothetical protein